jgi:hypothetical protein
VAGISGSGSQRPAELEEKVKDFENINDLFVGREFRIK